MTTRSRLRGARFFLPMMLASLRIRRQLAQSDEVVRWASVVAGPTEFWTVTVWHTRHDMQEFMRSGAHEEIMWLFSRWLTSFWLMRWRPGPLEIGTWRGRSIAQPEPEYERPHSAPQGATNEALDRALDHLPWLKAATGPAGAASYESTAAARRRRAEVGGASGALICLTGSPVRTPTMWRALCRLRTQARGDEGFLRATVGFGPPGEVYLLALWKDREGSRRLLESTELATVAQRWHGWANEWLPENEFGHWDGLRLRRARRSHAIPVPEAAMRSARMASDEAPSPGYEPR
ncbi:MAG: hypothetical protein M3063_10780 [Actinomycetota bacterium]|nr:hypothetical protein [Actinomycetota bacterium]